MTMWKEVETARKENRRELVLGGPEIRQRIQKDGLDKSIYQLTDLNFLSLTDTNLSELNPDISKLANLQTLILHSNKLEALPEAVSQLTKLKIIDVSSNSLKSVPGGVSSLAQIVTLNFSNNKLESFPPMHSNSKLTLLDLSQNCLKEFPDVCKPALINLSELKLQGNEIEEIPAGICTLPLLKLLDISNNKIKVLPGELADCSKLKEVNLKSNPISDRRLLKLIDQCRTKQIIDYVKQNCPKVGNIENGSSKKTKKGAKARQRSDGDSESEYSSDQASFKYSINVKLADEGFKVVVHNSTKPIREHIVCCLVNKVSFTESTFKEFIKLQNKLHDGVCNKRNSATIATHDFVKLGSSMVKYTTCLPTELKIRPLNRPSEVTGSELFLKLQTEANNLRKEKKRSGYSGIHKYLYLIEGKLVYPCLVNDKEEVISFPPITNADITKIEPSTSRMLIEVTSSVSQHVCKAVLTELLKELVYLLGQDVEVQAVRVVDEEDKLKLVFPAKNDLLFEDSVGIRVVKE